MSSQKARQTIVTIFIFLGLFVCATMYALNQPKFLAGTLVYLINKYPPSSIEVKEVTIEEAHWFSWDKMGMTNVRIKCKIKGSSYFFSAGTITIDAIRALVIGYPLFIEAKHLVVVSDTINMSDVQLQILSYFHNLQYKRSEILFATPRLEANHYVIEDLKGNLTYEQNYLDCSWAEGRFYGGNINFKGWNAAPVSYSMEIQFKSVHSALLADINPSFAQLTAVVDGNVQISNAEGRGLLLSADLKAPTGGSMKASLLKYLAQYVPQRQQVEDLIRVDADVLLSKAEMKVISLELDKITSEVTLNSSSLNLNMNVKFDINIEGGIDGLLKRSVLYGDKV